MRTAKDVRTAPIVGDHFELAPGAVYEVRALSSDGVMELCPTRRPGMALWMGWAAFLAWEQQPGFRVVKVAQVENSNENG